MNNYADLELNKQPEQIKLELVTPLESFFFYATFYSILILLTGYWGWIDDAPELMAKFIAGAGALATIVFALLYRFTDNFYILDIPRKRLLYRFEILAYKRVTLVRKFADIDALTVTGMEYRSKNGVPWWEYQTVMVDRRGEVIVLSDMKKNAFDESQELAKQIAGITGANYVEPAAKQLAEPVRDLNGRFIFEFREVNFFDRTWNLICDLFKASFFVIFLLILLEYLGPAFEKWYLASL